MTTCPFCSQPLGDGDRFCAGCGKSVSTSRSADAAPAAGAPPTSSPPAGFRWQWALLTIPIAVGTVLATSFAAGVIAATTRITPEEFSMPDALMITIVLGGMVVAGLVVGWLSPGRTVYEPGVGLAAAVVAMNAVGGDVHGVVMGWLVPFALGAGGAWLGEWLQRRFASP